MTRTLLAVVCAAGADAPAATQDPKKPDYAALAKGNRWEYRFTANGQTLDATAEVTDVVVRDGRRVVRSEVRIGGVSFTEERTTDDRGVYLHGVHNRTLDPPRTVLRFPVKAGDTWTEKYKDGDTPTEARSTVGDPETVTVPAGKFRAVPVETVIRTAASRNTSTTWYVDGIGVVKMTASLDQQPITVELVKFTPGK